MAQKGRYTELPNKIGLYSTSKGSFIKNDNDVVLSFPFKDAVLEAGMSKEDVGRDERFLHQTLDSKDIDTLEEPKVLTNFYYVDKNGETPLTASSDITFFDEDGNLQQNLLIKGNNLLTLYTLKSRFTKKVKLVYIDPPYNTGKDGFRYNDRFNHSAWLTFMKNRLEVTKDLLSDDGVVIVQCDDYEQAYLKVLMDEIFGMENFIANFVWRRSGTGGLRGIFPVTTHEYVLTYGKDLSSITERWLAPYSKASEADFKHSDENGRYKTQALYLTSLKYVDSQAYYIDLPDGTKAKPPQGHGSWRFIKKTYEQEKEAGNIVFKQTPNSPLVTESGDKAAFNIYTKQYMSEEGTNPSTILPDDMVGQTRTSKAELKGIFGKDVFDYAKPETLMRYLMELSTKEGDLVLDFCLGSGTTSAVAHKMNRRWVGVEQMDYIEAVAKERMKKVVAGEQGGVSKIVNWSGGGSFVYFELKKYNQEYIDAIMEATSIKELEDLYVDMRNNAFLKFWFDRAEFEKDENFRNKDLDGRKQALADILDENQLYLNYADMNDTRHKVSEDEKALTDKFYGENEN